MQAAWYEQLGAAKDVLRVGELDSPDLLPGHVLVKIYASGVNPSDVKQRSGWGGLKMRFPRVIPHNDGAGVIEAVGEGVAAARVGERVWIYEATLAAGQGTAADYAVVPADHAVALPNHTSFQEGACLGVPAMTAHHCVLKDGDVAGQTILVTGGAGAVGNYAIQLAKWKNAIVITTVSSDEKAAIASSAGADHVINYKTEDVVARVKDITNRKGCDRIVEVDFGANFKADVEMIKRNGAIATYASDAQPMPQVPTYDLIYKNLTVHYVLVYAMSKQAHQKAAKDITTALDAGALQHVIAEEFSLDQIAIAHERMESGSAIGNLILCLR